MSEEIVLHYVGDGACVAGVPACDLTQAMIETCGISVEMLLAFHNGDQPIYEKVKE